MNFLLKEPSLQSTTIKKLENEVCSLRTKINDLERYQSKDSVIIYNLPRKTNQVMEDVLRVFNNQLKVSVSRCDINACHHPSKRQDPRRLPPMIVEFLYFNKKKRIFARKELLEEENNPLNNQPSFHGKQLTKSVVLLNSVAEEKGLLVTTWISAPQWLIKKVPDFHKYKIQYTMSKSWKGVPLKSPNATRRSTFNKLNKLTRSKDP